MFCLLVSFPTKCVPEKVKYEAEDETCQADFIIIIPTPGGIKVHDCIV